MIRIEQVKATHKCNECSKMLYGPRHKVGSMRVHIHGSNYCITCSYPLIVEEKEKIERVINELKSKYGKLLVVDRLTRK